MPCCAPALPWRTGLAFYPATAQRRFTVCTYDDVTTVLLAAVVCRLADQAPGLALDVCSLPADMADVFERGDNDLLVMPEQNTAGLKHPQLVLFEDNQVCMV